MRGALPLFRFRGIQLLVHWTFLLLPAYVLVTGLMEGTAIREVLMDIGFVLIVFVCVVLHEFGHALTAQHFGVGTRNITLLPIGGIASLERMPEEPRQEFWITVAGPMVNLVIAGLALAGLSILGITDLFAGLSFNLGRWNALFTFLMFSNVGLFLFNLIPAFPMDGGRILRSSLSMWLPREKATRIATSIGRVFAIGFVLYGLMEGQPFLAIIGLFIFMSAGAEAKAVTQRSQTRSLPVRQRMRTGTISMTPTTTVQNAWNAIAMVDHRVLLVMDHGVFSGIIHREHLRQVLAEGRGSEAVGAGDRSAPPAQADEPAFPLYERMLASGIQALPVVEGDRVVGTVERRDLEDAFGPLPKV